ncbi:MAG: hypothetical protein GOU98_04010 [Candidatus Altiarchaeota archaeon]|nr:hypothetical protein [Candidatus Altiarchaeota archaeon]
MKKLVVGSAKDIASVNILRELGEVHKTFISDSSIVELPELQDEKRLLIVASPHSSKAGVKSFSVHTTGNFGKAKVGGKSKVLSIAPALYLGAGLRKFEDIKNQEKLSHQVTLEVTHHGPSFNTPIIYVEIGSDKKGWEDLTSAKAAAKVIEYLLDFEPEGMCEIGIGGPHYAPNFTKWTLKGKNFGHICPKYAAEELDFNLLKQMVDKTTPNPESLVFDWKGIPSSERSKIDNLANELGISTRKVR